MITIITGRHATDVYVAIHNDRYDGQRLFMWPEIDHAGRPYNSIDIVQWMHGFLDESPNPPMDMVIATMAEEVILTVVNHIIHKKCTPEEDFTFIYIDNSAIQHVLRIDTDGEFLDRWPDGMWDWRGDLLFTDGQQTAKKFEKVLRKS